MKADHINSEPVKQVKSGVVHANPTRYKIQKRHRSLCFCLLYVLICDFLFYSSLLFFPCEGRKEVSSLRSIVVTERA